MLISPWGGVKIYSFCLEVTERWTDSEGRPIVQSHHLPSQVRTAFSKEGLLREGGAPCKATIVLDANVMVLDAIYGELRLYTGHRLDGSVTMTAKGKSALSASFSNYEEPPDTYMYSSGQGAPKKPGDYGFRIMKNPIIMGLRTALAKWCADDAMLQDLLARLEQLA